MDGGLALASRPPPGQLLGGWGPRESAQTRSAPSAWGCRSEPARPCPRSSGWLGIFCPLSSHPCALPGAMCLNPELHATSRGLVAPPLLPSGHQPLPPTPAQPLRTPDALLPLAAPSPAGPPWQIPPAPRHLCGAVAVPSITSICCPALPLRLCGHAPRCSVLQLLLPFLLSRLPPTPRPHPPVVSGSRQGLTAPAAEPQP